jgi:trans-AT polyketide synthase/acyltransferase/oxidoreductase domain-containing protein
MVRIRRWPGTVVFDGIPHVADRSIESISGSEPMSTRPTQAEVIAQIGAWNSRFPIGTEVTTKLYPDRVAKTRSEATTLFNQKAVIYLEGFNGYFDLQEIHPAKRSDAETPTAPATPEVPAASQSAAPSVADTAPKSAGTNAAPGEKIAIMFPGQGAQRKGMGKDLFPAFSEYVEQADELLGYSIERLCVSDPDQVLDHTQYTQVALYVVNALGYLQGQEQGSLSRDADYFLGHSLGEYNALFAAGVFDFETGLRLVMKRGELMAAASGGAMAAVVRVEADELKRLLSEHGHDAIDLANFNTPTQTVISGPADAVGRAAELLSEKKMMVMPLKVSAAFHSRYMRDAQRAFSEFLKSFKFSAPARPVIANATGRPYEAEHIAQTLSEQIASPVLWTNSVRYLLELGPTQFVEVGSNILGKMVNETRQRSSK